MTDERVNAVLDVLAPWERYGDAPRDRFPLFEWGHETTPEAAEMIDLAQRVVASLGYL